jgi:NAD(P)H-hydrate epimerase
MFLPAFQDLKQMVPPRKPGGSKFDHGLVFMLCGSRGMLGSATLAAMSALRTGCGMVHCAVPHSAIPILSVKLTEPVLYSTEETAEGTPSSKGCDSLVERASSMQVALIGSGISHHPDTGLLVRNLLSKIPIPVVLDADGINAFKEHVNEIKKHKNALIITPHRREWERLFGTVPGNPVDLIGHLSQKAKEYSITIVFKGSPTIVADSRGKSYILPVGNSALATAGSGDVLSGIIASLIAQGCSPLDASILGVSIHGLAGEMASEKMGEYSVIASDLVEYISGVLNKLSPSKTAGMMF